MVFADTSGFVAAFDARDAWHAKGARAWRSLAKAGEALLTTDLVVAETVTHLRRRAGWEPSRRAGEAILKSHSIEVVCADRNLIDAAFREFVRIAAPKLSLCDALSFIVMRDRGISNALTLDGHFVDAGFSIIS
jgi:predicted nucleic acid-binding protein